jgi:hypothetical protein
MSERKIVDYVVLFSPFQDNISEKIKDHIKEGWQPYFGLLINLDNDFSQAMVKYED